MKNNDVLKGYIMIFDVNLSEIVNAIIEMNDASKNSLIKLSCGLEIKAWEAEDIGIFYEYHEIDIINAYINRT